MWNFEDITAAWIGGYILAHKGACEHSVFTIPWHLERGKSLCMGEVWQTFSIRLSPGERRTNMTTYVTYSKPRRILRFVLLEAVVDLMEGRMSGWWPQCQKLARSDTVPLEVGLFGWFGNQGSDGWGLKILKALLVECFLFRSMNLIWLLSDSAASLSSFAAVRWGPQFLHVPEGEMNRWSRRNTGYRRRTIFFSKCREIWKTSSMTRTTVFLVPCLRPPQSLVKAFPFWFLRTSLELAGSSMLLRRAKLNPKK